MVLVLPGVAVLLVAAVVALTGAGARRRGAGWPVTAVSALAFPVTWAVWYVRDEHPGDRYRSRTTGARRAV